MPDDPASGISAASHSSASPTYVDQSGWIVINEDKLVRVLESFEHQERKRPRLETWLSLLGMALTLFFVLATAAFHDVGPLKNSDVHTAAVTLLVLTGLGTLYSLIKWGIYALRHLKPETSEDKVAKIKKQSQEFAESLRAAEERLAVATPRQAASPLLRSLKQLRLQAELVRQGVPTFQGQNATEATEKAVTDWREAVSAALDSEPELKAQFDAIPEENPILAALKFHPLAGRLQNNISSLDAIIKYVEARDA